MKNKKLKHRIVSRLKGLEQQTKFLRKKIKKLESKKYDTYQLKSIKNILGKDARYHLLAYAILKGIPYKAVELKCAESNKPNAQLLFSIIVDLIDNILYLQQAPTINEIKVWLGEEIEKIQIIEQKPIEKKLTLLAKIIDLLGK